LNSHWTGFESVASAVGLPGLVRHQTTLNPVSSEQAWSADDGTARRIVVAEDEALIRMDLIEMLSGAGFDVVGQASDGRRAVELAHELRPDLVILDVKMPVLDGISAAEEIIGADVAPVLLLTAFSQRSLVQRAVEAGAMGYLVKPFTPQDLFPAIDIALARYEQMQELRKEVADLEQTLEARKLIERAKSILIAKFTMTEPEAFRWIQQAAMDRRLSMKDVASVVIDEADAGSGEES
jgi:AmiR/NasT family two-component response regulator